MLFHYTRPLGTYQGQSADSGPSRTPGQFPCDPFLGQSHSSALFVPLSGYVEKSCQAYYHAYTLTERNARLSGVLDTIFSGLLH